MNRYDRYLPFLEYGLKALDEWRESFANDELDDGLKFDREKWLELLDRFTERMKKNYPFHHPSYAGQMLKPPHPVAWVAYTLAATINPNNHALDGGPSTSEMEKEVIHDISRMAGYHDESLGHLTSGGTIANLEALWIARELHPEKAIASSSEAHYTHSRMCRVLNVDHLTVPVDAYGSPDMSFLNKYADKIGTLVVTMGTTGIGRVEPLHKLKEWADHHQIRIHIDAAYGGFFKLIAQETSGNADESDLLNNDCKIDPAPWTLMGEADSIVIDPHKHGLQPYGCGSVLFKDPAVGQFYKHDSPYTYFTSDELHLGEITLECSRAGASAAALWFTLQIIPLHYEGLGKLLQDCRQAAFDFAEGIRQSSDYVLYTKPELDIVTCFPATDDLTTSAVSKTSQQILKKGMSHKMTPIYLSLCRVPASHFTTLHPEYKADTEEVTILRSVLMKPEHKNYAGELLNRLQSIYE